ncbi:hypothetical protein [Selenomonas ruminantium]|uniref:hypothetical protein n=1 Tax=Selenomonas ruminantium TaxID=971 RepID=UPI00115F9268|nr:hypothetical protein [Selenomonas ruminantium]
MSALDIKQGEDWIKYMRNVITVVHQVREKCAGVLAFVPPCHYLRLSFLHIFANAGRYDPCFIVEFFVDDGDNPFGKALIDASDVLGKPIL